MIVASLDIGSTWTKGAAFDVDGDAVHLVRRAAAPTTPSHLADGFFSVLTEIVGANPLARLASGKYSLQYSSSAKGGLAVAAIGLVPEITLELGKVAAQSAGAKLTRVFAYELTRRDIAELEAAPPDILLFAGGTDGGNTRYVLANADALACSSLDCEIVYAGNRAVADEVAERLAGKRLRIVDNLLPAFDEPNPEPARDALRDVFLETIVHGKGLDVIMQATGVAPLPTPFAVLEYVRAIHRHVPGWDDFLLFDMGGATTDVYSAHTETPEPGTVLRGLPEPLIKRTVEGDLGMRVSAQSVARLGGPAYDAQLARAGFDAATLAFEADGLAAAPERIAANDDERRLDTLLATLCVGHACARHAGRSHPVYTPDGEIRVQTGRDLRRVRKLIGSGGWLAHTAGFAPAAGLADHVTDGRGRSVLVPGEFTYYRDEQYLFPLLANLARAYPRAAAHAGIRFLRTDGPAPRATRATAAGTGTPQTAAPGSPAAEPTLKQ